MRVLVAIDDSPYSEHVLEAVCTRQWPANTWFRIISVIQPLVSDLDMVCELGTDFVQVQRGRQEYVQNLCEQARRQISNAVTSAIVDIEIPTGEPQEEILESAAGFAADKILIGARGRDVCPHYLPGSVSRAVINNAKCSVEMIRPRVIRGQETVEGQVAVSSL